MWPRSHERPSPVLRAGGEFASIVWSRALPPRGGAPMSRDCGRVLWQVVSLCLETSWARQDPPRVRDAAS